MRDVKAATTGGCHLGYTGYKRVGKRGAGVGRVNRKITAHVRELKQTFHESRTIQRLTSDCYRIILVFVTTFFAYLHSIQMFVCSQS